MGRQRFVPSGRTTPRGERQRQDLARREFPSGKQLMVLTSDNDLPLLKEPDLQPGRTKIAAIADNTMVRVWTSEGTRLTLLKGHTADVTSLSFAPDNWRIVTSSLTRRRACGMPRAVRGILIFRPRRRRRC